MKSRGTSDWSGARSLGAALRDGRPHTDVAAITKRRRRGGVFILGLATAISFNTCCGVSGDRPPFIIPPELEDLRSLQERGVWAARSTDSLDSTTSTRAPSTTPSEGRTASTLSSEQDLKWLQRGTWAARSTDSLDSTTSTRAPSTTPSERRTASALSSSASSYPASAASSEAGSDTPASDETDHVDDVGGAREKEKQKGTEEEVDLSVNPTPSYIRDEAGLRAVQRALTVTEGMTPRMANVVAHQVLHEVQHRKADKGERAAPDWLRASSESRSSKLQSGRSVDTEQWENHVGRNAPELYSVLRTAAELHAQAAANPHDREVLQELPLLAALAEIAYVQDDHKLLRSGRERVLRHPFGTTRRFVLGPDNGNEFLSKLVSDADWLRGAKQGGMKASMAKRAKDFVTGKNIATDIARYDKIDESWYAPQLLQMEFLEEKLDLCVPLLVNQNQQRRTRTRAPGGESEEVANRCAQYVVTPTDLEDKNHGDAGEIERGAVLEHDRRMSDRSLSWRATMLEPLRKLAPDWSTKYWTMKRVAKAAYADDRNGPRKNKFQKEKGKESADLDPRQKMPTGPWQASETYLCTAMWYLAVDPADKLLYVVFRGTNTDFSSLQSARDSLGDIMHDLVDGHSTASPVGAAASTPTSSARTVAKEIISPPAAQHPAPAPTPGEKTVCGDPAHEKCVSVLREHFRGKPHHAGFRAALVSNRKLWTRQAMLQLQILLRRIPKAWGVKEVRFVGHSLGAAMAGLVLSDSFDIRLGRMKKNFLAFWVPDHIAKVSGRTFAPPAIWEKKRIGDHAGSRSSRIGGKEAAVEWAQSAAQKTFTIAAKSGDEIVAADPGRGSEKNVGEEQKKMDLVSFVYDRDLIVTSGLVLGSQKPLGVAELAAQSRYNSRLIGFFKASANPLRRMWSWIGETAVGATNFGRDTTEGVIFKEGGNMLLQRSDEPLAVPAVAGTSSPRGAGAQLLDAATKNKKSRASASRDLMLQGPHNHFPVQSIVDEIPFDVDGVLGAAEDHSMANYSNAALQVLQKIQMVERGELLSGHQAPAGRSSSVTTSQQLTKLLQAGDEIFLASAGSECDGKYLRQSAAGKYEINADINGHPGKPESLFVEKALPGTFEESQRSAQVRFGEPVYLRVAKHKYLGVSGAAAVATEHSVKYTLISVPVEDVATRPGTDHLGTTWMFVRTGISPSSRSNRAHDTNSPTHLYFEDDFVSSGEEVALVQYYGRSTTTSTTRTRGRAAAGPGSGSSRLRLSCTSSLWEKPRHDSVHRSRPWKEVRSRIPHRLGLDSSAATRFDESGEPMLTKKAYHLILRDEEASDEDGLREGPRAAGRPSSSTWRVRRPLDLTPLLQPPASGVRRRAENLERFLAQRSWLVNQRPVAFGNLKRGERVFQLGAALHRAAGNVELGHRLEPITRLLSTVVPRDVLHHRGMQERVRKVAYCSSGAATEVPAEGELAREGEREGEENKGGSSRWQWSERFEAACASLASFPLHALA